MPPSPTSTNETSAAILEALNHLIEVVAQLRSPDGGCPWDLEQTPQTLIPYVIEEAYEVVAAIRSEDPTAIAEELGDLLLQVVLQAQIASELDHFSMIEVAEGIATKLIRRHPHVFGEVKVSNTEEVRQNWEKIKAAEKGENPEKSTLLSEKLSRYSQTLPPLMAGAKISEKAAAAGFEWENIAGVWDKFAEELAEFQQSLTTDDKAHQASELGDLLFVILNLARWYDLDAAEALHETNQRFIQRISQMEKLADRPLNEYNLEELEAFWQEAKLRLK